MGEPLARMDLTGDGVLADAADRLERALQALEAALDRSAPGVPNATAQVVELETARRRGQELETAAAEASRALGRAMADVRRALQDDELDAQDPQPSLFDSGLLTEDPPDATQTNSPLESQSGLAADQSEAEAVEAAAEKEPTE